LITGSCKVPNVVTNLANCTRGLVEGRGASATSTATIVGAVRVRTNTVGELVVIIVGVRPTTKVGVMSTMSPIGRRASGCNVNT
jgi:hypothetical protein